MRVPVQAPALARNQRGQPVRRSGGGWIEGYGVTPSQYEGDDDGGGEGAEGAEDEGGESGGDEGGNEAEADSSVESEG